MSDTMFASEGEVAIEFPDAWVVWIREEMPYGFQDELENNQIRMIQGKKNGGEPDQEAHISMGNLQLLQLMITKIVDPDGKVVHATMGLLRKLSRSRVARILDEINKRNPPFSALLENTSEVLD